MCALGSEKIKYFNERTALGLSTRDLVIRAFAS